MQTPNFIPNEAIANSERAKNPPPQKGRPPQSKDPYNEDHVSKDQPSIEEVKKSPPDDTVKGG